MSGKRTADFETVDQVVSLLHPLTIQVSPLTHQLRSVDASVVHDLLAEAMVAAERDKRLFVREMWSMLSLAPGSDLDDRIRSILGVLWVYRTFSTADHLNHLASGEILKEVRSHLNASLWNMTGEEIARFSAPMALIKCMDLKAYPAFKDLQWINTHLYQLVPYAATIRSRARWDVAFLSELLESNTPAISAGML